MDAVLYRDDNYGALGVVKEGRNIVTYDHGFSGEDFDVALGVLYEHGTPAFCEDGSAVWELTSHQAVVLASLQEALRSCGYSDDTLGERAIFMSVSDDFARSPDLPSDRDARISERVAIGLREHLSVGLSVLDSCGDYALVEVKHLARPNSTDAFGRPLPMARARAIIRKPVERAHDVQLALREALSPIEGSLLRASVSEADGSYMVEVAFLPPAEAVESYTRGALPTFNDVQGTVRGVRTARFVLNGLPTVEEIRDIEERAVACTAASSIATPNSRTIVARVPAGMVEGSAAGDNIYSRRVAWLHEQFEEWEPELVFVGGVEPLLGTKAT